MKKIYIEDIKQNGNITVTYNTNEIISTVNISLTNNIVNYNNNIQVSPNELKSLMDKYKKFILENEDELIWKARSIMIILKKMEIDETVECNIEIYNTTHHCLFVFHFSLYQLENLAEVEEYPYFAEESIDVIPYFYLTKISQNKETIDYNFHYQDGILEINKPFWVYDFELDEICKGLEDYLKNGNIKNISINDSYLWLYLKPNNKVKIETRNLEIPPSSIELEFTAEKSMVINMYKVFSMNIANP